MTIAAIVFFAIAAIAAVVLLMSHFLSSGDVATLRRADKVLDELSNLIDTPLRDSVVARIEASMRPKLEAEAKAMTDLVRDVGRRGDITPEELHRMSDYIRDLEAWCKRVRAVREKSEQCTSTAFELLITTMDLFTAMANEIRSESPEAADNLMSQVAFLQKCRETIRSSPLPLTMVVISVLSRIDAMGDGKEKLVSRARQINAMIELFKGAVRDDAAVDELPVLFARFDKANLALVKAVGRCNLVVRGESRFRRVVPAVQAIPKRYIVVLDALENISSALH